MKKFVKFEFSIYDLSADVDVDLKRRRESTHEVDCRQGRTVLGGADSGQRAQTSCTQSAVAPAAGEVLAKAASHGRISGPRR